MYIMGIIMLEFDNTLEKSKIEMSLISSSKEEAGEDFIDTNMTDKAQTAVFGIQVPLIMINTTIIDFDSIHYFNLKSEGTLPELVMTVEDKYELMTNIDKPSQDNEVRVQIIPRFDNAYKKVDLTFFITDISIIGSMVRLVCTYKVPALISSQFKSLGEIDTYTLFKTIATETKLGFATNIAQQSDNRYVYCNNKSYFDLMNDEIEYANASEHIMDYWIDLWDNINLVDIKERYETIDSDDDLKIWISGQLDENTVGVENIPQETVATLNNYPSFKTSELFVKEYNHIVSPGGQISKGSDKIYGIYEDVKSEHFDYLIQDGDIKNDIFTKYDYIGESYGEYNYLLSKCIRAGFLQKVNSECIKVTLQSPLLGLMRGHKVNFIRYVNDDLIESKMTALEEIGVLDRNVEANIPLDKYEMDDDSGSGKFRIDKTVSGQYLIHAVDIIFNNGDWDYVLTLVKSAYNNVNILNKE